MRLTFLGTGSAMPTGERVQTGLLLEAGERRLLVDCGSGTLHRLAATDVSYEGIDTVLLTHHHLDHVADLLPLLKARWLADCESLTVVGPPGTTEMVEGLLDVHEYLRGRIDLTIREVGPTAASDQHHIAGFDVAAMETRHSMYGLAYRLSVPDEEGTVTFSGDSEAFEDLVAFADGSSVLVHDCSFPDGIDAANHPTPATLGKALGGADADVGTVYLSHLYPHTDGKHDEMIASIREHYDSEVEFARDGHSVELA